MSLSMLVTPSECQKCEKQADLCNRKENMCHDCFNRFMRGKLRKCLRSDTYKVNSKHGMHRVMLAFNGNNSLSSLDMIQDLLHEQYLNFGKTGFEVLVVNIDEGNEVAAVFEKLKLHYKSNPVEINYKIIKLEQYLTGKNLIRISIDKKFNILVKPEQNYTMSEILQLIPNKSSVEDFKQILYLELLLQEAKHEGCGTIMYNNSMNQLSSLVLSTLIKGRGSNLHIDINDTIIEGIQIMNPLRELFEVELRYYNKLNELLPFETQPQELSKINKNLTINQITTRYLNQVESNGYASTIPTVLKISEKLIEPSKFHPVGSCKICNQTIYQNPKQWLNKITINDAAPLLEDSERDYLAQYLQSYVADVEYDVSDLNVCYGCMVSMQGAQSIVWPSEDVQKQAILDEYILDSEDE